MPESEPEEQQTIPAYDMQMVLKGNAQVMSQKEVDVSALTRVTTRRRYSGYITNYHLCIGRSRYQSWSRNEGANPR